MGILCFPEPLIWIKRMRVYTEELLLNRIEPCLHVFQRETTGKYCRVHETVCIAGQVNRRQDFKG